MTTSFNREADFEDAVVDLLTRHGWESEVLHHLTEQQLIDNWAQILFDNNRSQDRLGDIPLTDSEMAQIIEQVVELRTPLALNEFINGRTVSITRDAPGAHNVGMEVSLKIYDRMEIAGGQSRYQIVRQPYYATKKSELLPERRGDLMLLINGMPVFHIELKRSGVPISEATNQIAKYAHEGVYQNIYSLVQIFVAMTPEETVYFANPGPDGEFNRDFFFHWADFNNEPVNEWDRVTRMLLSIPMAHQMIGFYTVADRDSGNLLVMRSYQYFAASRIADKVESHDWSSGEQRGGYIWHTTGSGKTITSFKTAQLIADSNNADKVVFLLDRIELGTQSLKNYRSYGGDSISVADTASSGVLESLLKDDTTGLIVTSLHKMSRITEESTAAGTLDTIRDKRVVFIIDEAHRSTFGDMLTTIKKTLPNALFFGFTGTPIHEENSKKQSDTSTIFGDELHRYSIADGIRDGNVLGFDPEMVETYSAHDMRKQVALRKADASSEKDALADPDKAEIYLKFMDKKQVPMATSPHSVTGKNIKGVEAYIPTSQYRTDEHRRAVVKDITEHWSHLSRNSEFHAILATASIQEAIEYYRIFATDHPELAVTGLFDPSIDNTGDGQRIKEDGLSAILADYNKRFNQNFKFSTHAEFKRDVSARLAHKKPYHTKEFTRDKQIDLLIVVDQMLTGFDSKWLNTLYLDKTIEYESIIQAFSRTNRIFGPRKPFGSIRYYRRPHTMKKNIDRAVSLYSGDKPFGLFAERLDVHLTTINTLFIDITALFSEHPDFSVLPNNKADQGEFAKLFSELYQELQAALIQGFTWDTDTYYFDDREPVTVTLTEETYLTLIARYKELRQTNSGDGDATTKPPIDIDIQITHIDTERIDADYLDNKFQKYLRGLHDDVPAKQLNELLEDLHSSFARLSAEDQRYANRWLHDLQAGDITLEPGKSFRDYITDYRISERDKQISYLHEVIGINPAALRAILDASVTSSTINEYGRFDTLKEGVDLTKASNYFATKEGKPVSEFVTRRNLDKLLRDFILHDVLPSDLRVDSGKPEAD